MTLIPWLMEPDWTDGVSEVLAWKTDILQSPTGAEQRIARRLSPRREFEFAIMPADNDRQAIEHALFHAGGAEWALPVYPDVALLTTPLRATDTVVPVATSGRDFIAGDPLLLKSGLGWLTQYEQVTIESVTADGIQLTQGLTRDWAAGTLVYPVRPAVLVEQPELTRHTSRLSGGTVRFRLAAHNAWSQPAAPMPVYQGYPVLDIDPDWSEDVTGQYTRLLLELDNNVGIPDITDTALRPFFVQAMSWTALGRERQSAMRSLLYYMRGRQRPLWVVNPTDDLTPVAGVNGHILDVMPTQFSDYGAVAGRRDLCILLTDGTRLYRRIIAMAAYDGYERLVLAGDAVTVSLTDILALSFMTLSRLNEDELTWKHTTDADGVASLSLTFIGVRDDELE